ncbi:PREDICTED: serine/threonine-protein kinase KIN4 [Wasmannia auropunctata]|uniref:serine/threonine-protein kinase KIN4 n=1 Tax=Wasmannia auropunctata TaxID=64793 RepID=UPI0005EFACA7|nr:PREDICTED: serine/threonine-protein kinase KIN4 [Wasmannia auropunctata]XP_011685590.1 PREDICTED: serine/threonine-protein kinase KIN4 [Wasmannia auropunctata]
MSGMKKAIGGSIHRIREFELEKVNLIEEFDILQIVGEGWFGKILLTEHRSTQTEMVLKALPKAYTGITDFFREFHYGLHLSAHRNIITTYDVAFETAGFYVFSQEYAPLGDLTSNVTETGLGELHAKRVARQLAAAVHHIHSRELVHRDIKLDNVLIFRSDFSRIKLCDFGETRRVNTVVRRHNEWLPYSPPEVLQIDTDETYKAYKSHDVWQFGIVLFVCLTGCLPWQKAAMDDPRYTRYQNWHNATLNIAKKPKLFQLISSRAQRMFKRLLDPKAEKRPVSVLEVNKYLEDRWLAKLGAEKALNGGADERDELCPSMYSFHSSLEEKNQLLHTLTTYGIETTVDHSKKKDRIREWIQASAIVEENEEDESDIYEDSEFYEDEDRENDGNGNEEVESISMRGRHFPERRPSAAMKDPRKRRGSSRVPTSRVASKNRAPAKPVERKIPFAPQVAEERETIARFASFPNGDPNLAAAVSNGGGDRTHDLAATSVNVASPATTNNFAASNQLQSSAPSPNGRHVTDPARTSANNSRDESPLSAQPVSAVSVKQSPPRITGIPESGGRVVPMSPQIPARKNRAHTAPFLDARSVEARADLAKRAQSATVLRTSETPEDPPLPPRASAKTSGSPHPTTARTDNPSAATLSTSRAARSIAPPVARADRAPAAPIIGNASLAESQPPNSALPGRVEGSPPTATQVATSAASHLAMQSFNALQGIAGAPSAAASPATASSSTSKPGQRAEKANVTYGKDAYEHYGIAQGIVLPMRVNIVRQDSTGSGSRSVSN